MWCVRNWAPGLRKNCMYTTMSHNSGSNAFVFLISDFEWSIYQIIIFFCWSYILTFMPFVFTIYLLANLYLFIYLSLVCTVEIAWIYSTDINTTFLSSSPITFPPHSFPLKCSFQQMLSVSFSSFHAHGQLISGCTTKNMTRTILHYQNTLAVRSPSKEVSGLSEPSAMQKEVLKVPILFRCCVK